mgnify:CR=1 FL=1
MKGRFVKEKTALHIYQRTSDKGLLFYTSRDYIVYLTLLCTLSRKKGIPVLAVSPMVDHTHLSLRAGTRDEIFPLVQELNKQYSRIFNSSVGRRGSLFEKSFGCAAKRGDKAIRTNLSYVNNNAVEKKLVARAEGYKWNLLAYAISSHPFSEEIVLREASMQLRRALKEVAAMKKIDRYLNYAILDRLYSGLGKKERDQLTDYILYTYSCIDYKAIEELYGSYEKACLAFASNQGSEHEIKEDFDPGSDRIYAQISNTLLSKYGFKNPKDALVLALPEKVDLFNDLLFCTKASAYNLEKYLHIRRTRRS